MGSFPGWRRQEGEPGAPHPPVRSTWRSRAFLQDGVGAQLPALPGALLLPALPTFPPALPAYQAADELRGQHGGGAAAWAPLTSGALGHPPRTGNVTCAAGLAGECGLRAPLGLPGLCARLPGSRACACGEGRSVPVRVGGGEGANGSASAGGADSGPRGMVWAAGARGWTGRVQCSEGWTELFRFVGRFVGRERCLWSQFFFQVQLE